MKNLFLITVIFFGVATLNAQDKSAKEYKIEGAEAYKAKDYAKGLSSFEQAIKLYEADGKTDTSLYYNVAICAYKEKEYEKALTYFDKAIGLNYKSCKANIYKANSLKKLGRLDEMEALCIESKNTCPKYESKFDDLLFQHYLKAGLAIFNNAAKMQSSATPFASSDPDKYTAEMEKVKQEFNNSLPMLEKAHSIKPDDENCKTALKQAYELLEMNAKAAAL